MSNNGAPQAFSTALTNVESGFPTNSMSNARFDFALREAANLIKNIDDAHALANASAIDAAREVEYARRNARAARDIARQYMGSYKSGAQTKISFPAHSGLTEDNDEALSTTPRKISSAVSAAVPTTAITPLRPMQPPSPPMRQVNSDSKSQNGGSGTKKRIGQNTTPSSEREAQRKTDEILRMTLELENLKETLESEQMAHDETKSALAQSKLKNKQLESQMESLLSQMETSRETNGRKMDELERNLADARMRVEAAEEDADTALEIAQQNTESRQHMEGLLAKAYQQVEDLKNQLTDKESQLKVQLAQAHPPPPRPPRQPPLPSSARSALKVKTVRFADSPIVLSKDDLEQSALTTPASRQSRSMVGSGRQLVQRSLGRERSTEAESPPNVSNIEIILESASKYKLSLQERLRNMSGIPSSVPPGSINLPYGPLTPQATPTALSPRQSFWSPSELERANKTAVNILRESGKKLNLTGRLWSNNQSTKEELAKIHIDTLAKQYCTSVEVMLDKKQKDIIELESLCALWEKDGSAV